MSEKEQSQAVLAVLARMRTLPRGGASERGSTPSVWLGRAISEAATAIVSPTANSKFRARLTMKYGASLCGCLDALRPVDDDDVQPLLRAGHYAEEARVEGVGESHLVRSLEVLGSTVAVVAAASSEHAETAGPPDSLIEAIGLAAAAALNLDPDLADLESE